MDLHFITIAPTAVMSTCHCSPTDTNYPSDNEPKRFRWTHAKGTVGVEGGKKAGKAIVKNVRILAHLHQKVGAYSRARLIRTANARKNRVNYPSMRIIRTYFTLHFYQQQRVVSKASM